MKTKKYKGIINIYTSIIFDIKKKEIRVCSDAGRLTRPVLRVLNNKLILNKNHVTDLASNNLSWEDLLTDSRMENSIIEYIDPAEQNQSMIAM